MFPGSFFHCHDLIPFFTVFLVFILATPSECTAPLVPRSLFHSFTGRLSTCLRNRRRQRYSIEDNEHQRVTKWAFQMGPLKLRGFSCQYVRKPITGSNKQQAVVLPVTAVMLINRPSVMAVFSIRRGFGSEATRPVPGICSGRMDPEMSQSTQVKQPHKWGN